MKIKNKKIITSKGGNINEDIFGVCHHGAWVLDGSTGLTKVNVTKSDSDAMWLVKQWNEYLYKNINNDMNLYEIIHAGIAHTKENFRKLQGRNKLDYIDLPSSSISIIRYNHEYLEYFILGDCCILYKDSDRVQRIYDDRVSRLDKRVIERITEIRETKKVSALEARLMCLEDLKRNRQLKNTREGYWVLGFDEEAVCHALTGKLAVHNKINICMITDGFSQYYDTFNLAENEAEFFKKLENEDVKDLLLQMRRVQDMDEFCEKYPRLKKSDDATLVYLELCQAPNKRT